MKTFTITYEKTVRHTATLAAKNKQEAIGKFMAFQPDDLFIVEVKETEPDEKAEASK